jgi:hypothetical protein
MMGEYVPFSTCYSKYPKNMLQINYVVSTAFNERPPLCKKVYQENYYYPQNSGKYQGRP